MFIASVDITKPMRFEGYAWVGDDLVVGQTGADEFARENGPTVPPDEDGCYVTVHEVSEGLVVGTDYRGLRRLFTYTSGEKWAIASNIYELISKVRQLGWPLTVMEDTIAAYLSNSGFSAQISAFGVHFAEVNLVPSAGSILILGDRISTIFREPQEIPDYHESLERFLVTWKNRLGTLSVASQTKLKFDLSGGIDSRTVLAFAIENGEILDGGARIESSSKPRAAEDFKVASTIADKYGFELNSKSYSFRSPNLSAEGAFEGWKRHSLGVYSPVYLYNTTINSNFVHAHGAGGGNFRPTYKSIQRAASQVGERVSKENSIIWSNRVVNDLTSLTGFSTSKSLELIHYREYRNRFHFGHRPHQTIVYMPLESKLTDPLTDRSDDRDGRQIYYDVMESLAPGLSTMAYDLEEKMPTDSNISRMMRVATPPSTPGRVYAESSNSPDIRTKREEVFGLWIDSALSRFSTEKVSQLLPQLFRDAVDETFSDRKYDKTKCTPNSIGMKGLSHALTIDFLLNPDSTI